MSGQGYDATRVKVSPDGQWVYDGYKWWPLADVPAGVQTAEGYVWDGQAWQPPAQSQQVPAQQFGSPQTPPQPPKRSLGTWTIVAIVVGCIVVALVVFGVLGSMGSSSNTSAGGSATPSQSQSNGVSKGFGSQDASGDISIGSTKTEFGTTTVQIKAKNQSEKRSDYFVSVAVESADGKTQYDTSTAVISNVDPGQTATGDAMFMKDFPKGAKVVVKEVSRTSAVG